MAKPAQSDHPPAHRLPHPIAQHAVRLAALWVLAGAASKAVSGMPTDLPYFFATSDFDPIAVVVLGVFVECALATLALIAPRVGRIPIAALLALFAVLLIHHVTNTDASCGCFGGAQIPAPVMLATDLAFLALVGWTFRKQPPRTSAPRVLAGVFAGVLVGAGAAAFTHDRLERTVGGGAAGTPGAPAAPTWRMPTEIPEQVLLRPLTWVGKPLAQTPLGTWIDTAPFPARARLIFFYKSCNHCAALLEELAEKQASDPASAPTYVLVQLPTPAAYTGKLFVETVPPHALWVELPSVIKAYVMTPPWIVDVDGGKIVRAERIPWPGEKAAGK